MKVVFVCGPFAGKEAVLVDPVHNIVEFADFRISVEREDYITATDMCRELRAFEAAKLSLDAKRKAWESATGTPIKLDRPNGVVRHVSEPRTNVQRVDDLHERMKDTVEMLWSSTLDHINVDAVHRYMDDLRSARRAEYGSKLYFLEELLDLMKRVDGPVDNTESVEEVTHVTTETELSVLGYYFQCPVIDRVMLWINNEGHCVLVGDQGNGYCHYIVDFQLCA